MDERAQRLLVQYDLSERESLVYLTLLSRGKQSAGEIAKAVEIRRMEAYRVMKRLAEAGIIVASPGNPVKYTAEPIEQVVAMMMDRQMKKLEEMEKDRAEVVSIAKTLAGPGQAPKEEYSFRMVQGREQIYAQIVRMVDAAAKSVEMVLTRNDLIQLYVLGLVEHLKEAKKRGVKVHAISILDHQTTEAADGLARVAELRHSEDFARSRMIIADKDSVLVSLVLDEVVGRKNERDVAIWTNSGDYAATMLPMFTKAFEGGVEGRERLHELKTGRKGEERAKAMVDIVRASLPLEGWKVEAPAKVKGVSGAEYEVSAVVKDGDRAFAVDIVMGNDEDDLKESIIGAIMKGVEVRAPRLVVIASPFSGDDLPRLASLVGVALIDGADPVLAASRLRKEIATP